MGAPYGNCNAGTGKTCSPASGSMPSAKVVNAANMKAFGPKSSMPSAKVVNSANMKAFGPKGRRQSPGEGSKKASGAKPPKNKK